MANEPTQYPDDVAPGGLAQATQGRPLRGPPAVSVRQPYLGNPPRVSAATGLGTGGGAYVRNQGSEADESQGIVVLRCGINPAASGSIALAFTTPPLASTYWTAADWATLSPSLAGSVLTIAWTATRTLRPNEHLHLAYQWSVSQ